MKIKQIILATLPLMLVVSLFAAVLAPAGNASALSDAENKKCFEDWVSQSAGKTRVDNMKKTKCYKANGSGQCKVEEERGATRILCKRSDGTFASSGAYKVSEPSKDPEETEKEPEKSGTEGGSLIAGNDCGGVKTAIIKCSQNNTGDSVTNNGVWGLLLMALNIMTAGVGILAVGGIVYGAILYTTAEDKADQIKKATGIITNVVIGLIMFALMWSGLNFLIPGGIFS